MVCVGGFIALFPTPLPHQFNYSLPAWLKQFLSFHIPGFHGHCPEQASTVAAQNRLASLSMVATYVDNSAIYWLILATGISGLTSSLLYLCQRSCTDYWHNVGSICWQRLSSLAGLREETFQQVTNLLIFPRIFEQLGLQTFQMIWKHDANAQTRDCVQWGWFRLPSKSFVISFLSLCGVTHYVYIPMDLKYMTIVGPVEAIILLVDLSNVAATTRLNEFQLDSLRQALGLGDAWTEADELFTRWERRVACCMLLVCYISLPAWVSLSTALGLGMCLFAVSAVCRFWRAAMATASSLWYYLPRLPLSTGVGSQLERELEDLHEELSQGLVEQVVIETGADISLEEEFWGAADDNSEASEIMHLPGSRDTQNARAILYSLVLARGFFFEVVKQIWVTPCLEEMMVRFADSAQVYALPTQPNFVHYLAERTAVSDNASLHICVYNPLLDPYLAHIYQNFQKGVDRENVVMVILPPLMSLDESLTSRSTVRARTADCTQFVGQLIDMELLLLQMTAGHMPKLVFVLPTDAFPPPSQQETNLWVAFKRVLGEVNCHWPCTE